MEQRPLGKTGLRVSALGYGSGAIGGLFTFLPVTLTSVRRIGQMPEPVVEPTPAQAELEGGLVEGVPLPGPAAADA